MKHASGKNCERQKGFTLLEVMISLSLMVLLFSLLYGGFRYGYQSWNVATDKMNRHSEYQTTYRIAGQWLSRLYPASIKEPLSETAYYAFNGTQSQISFSAFMPSFPTRGGLYEILLSVEKSRNEPEKLTLNRRMFDPHMQRSLPYEPDQKVILLENGQGIYFEYFGRKPGDDMPHWYGDWAEPHLYPTLIRIRLSGDQNSLKGWPDMIIPLKVNQDSLCLHPGPEDRLFCNAVRQAMGIEHEE